MLKSFNTSIHNLQKFCPCEFQSHLSECGRMLDVLKCTSLLWMVKALRILSRQCWNLSHNETLWSLSKAFTFDLLTPMTKIKFLFRRQFISSFTILFLYQTVTEFWTKPNCLGTNIMGTDDESIFFIFFEFYWDKKFC